jgi:hypothetical protein
VRRRFRVLDANVGNREGDVDDAHAELPVRFLLGGGIERRHDRRRHASMQPCDRLALRVDAGFEVLDRHGMEVVVVQIVVARPDDLDGLAIHRFRQDGRLDSVIGLGLAAEPATQQRHVDGHVLGGHVEALGDQVARRLRRLEAAPDFAFAAVMRALAAGGSIDACARCGQ